MAINKTIPFSHFVKITSAGVAATFAFNRLNALVMSSPAVPQSRVSEYLTLEAVGKAYGFQSPEYQYAAVFFGYVSKTAATPERLSFYRWAKEATPAALKGAAIPDLAAIKQSGGFTLDIDGTAETITADLSAATSFADAAAQIAAALEGKATCSYDEVTGGFIITSAQTGSAHTVGYAFAPASGADISTDLGLSQSAGASVIEGLDAKTFAEALNDISLINGNWVSVASLAELTPATDFETASEWTKASEGRYCFVANDPSPALRTSAIRYENLFGNDGFIGNAADDITMNAFTQAAIASVDFSAVNGAMNFNFIEADAFSGNAVDTAEELEAVNSQRFNCVYIMGGYGQSQPLYGEGNIFGNTFSDISGFIGNAWLKAQLEIYGANTLISLPLVSLRGAGSSVMLTALQEPVNLAKTGGIIVPVGIGNLTALERTAVIAAAGDPDTPETVEQNGYYMAVRPVTQDDITLKRVRLLLIYTRNVPVNRVVVQNFVLGA